MCVFSITLFFINKLEWISKFMLLSCWLVRCISGKWLQTCSYMLQKLTRCFKPQDKIGVLPAITKVVHNYTLKVNIVCVLFNVIMFIC